jgi:hypothetical protein
VPSSTSRSPRRTRGRSSSTVDVEELAHAGREALHVAVGLECQEVGAEHSAQELLAPRADPEHARGREGDVPEHADTYRQSERAEGGRHEAQVEVVHPHEVARPRLVGDERRVVLVRVLISEPELAIESAALGEDVAERPQDLIREAAVEVLELLGVELRAANG